MNKYSIIIVSALAGLVVGLELSHFFIDRDDDHHHESADMHSDIHHNEDLHETKEMGMQHSMDQMMFGLEGKAGEAYEKAFLEMMIIHHIGAIEMAEDLLEQTERPELIQMANDIITVQNQEVTMMREWQEKWFSN